MRTAWAALPLVFLFAANPWKAADPAHAQAGRPAVAPVQPQRPGGWAPATVVSPAEGEVVTGDLHVVVETAPEVGARRYTLEVSYWDTGRNVWFYPGNLGDEFAGGARAVRLVTAAEFGRYSATATRWRLRARVTDPPGSWGPWRAFGWSAAPAAVGAERARDSELPAVQGRKTPPAPAAALPTGRQPASETAAPARSPEPPAAQGREAPARSSPAQAAAEPARATDLPAQQGRGAPPASAGALPRGRQPPSEEPGSTRSSGLPAVQGREAAAGPPAVPPSVRQPAPDLPAPSQSSELPAVQGGEPAPDRAAGPPTGRQSPAAESRAGAPQPPQSPAVAKYLASPGGQTFKLRLWNGIGTVEKQRVYVDGPVDVDWERKDLQWWFEYRASGSQRGPMQLRWELSRATFPAWGEWHPVPGFSLTGLVEGAKEFRVDLAPLAPRPPGWAQKVSPVPKSALGQDVTVAMPEKAPSSPHLPDIGGVPQPGADGDGASEKKKSLQKPPSTEGSLAGGPAAVSLAEGAVSSPVAPALLSLYLRVVPVDTAGTPAGPASNAVELRFGPQEKQPPFQFDVAWPDVTFAGYRPVRPYDFDWQCWVVASQDWVDPISGKVILPKGTKKNLCEKEDTNIVEDIIDAIGSFAEMLGDFVDWLSDTYASLKNELVSAVAGAIPGCSTSPPCRGAVEMGLNAGLAAVGMPPELPDFEQLQAMGEGYLVDMMAQQAAQTGVPFAEDAARKAVKEMIAKGKEALSSGGGGSSLWIPDASRQYKPLLVTVRVANPSPKPTTAVYLEVAETGSGRYLPRKVPVPSLAPQESYEIAVALEPSDDPAVWMEEFSGAKASPFESIAIYLQELSKAQAAHAAWKAKYTQGHVNLQVTLQPQWNSSTGYQVAFQKTCQAGAPACLVQ